MQEIYDSDCTYEEIVKWTQFKGSFLLLVMKEAV